MHPIFPDSMQQQQPQGGGGKSHQQIMQYASIEPPGRPTNRRQASWITWNNSTPPVVFERRPTSVSGTWFYINGLGGTSWLLRGIYTYVTYICHVWCRISILNTKLLRNIVLIFRLIYISKLSDNLTQKVPSAYISDVCLANANDLTDYHILPLF